MFTIDKYSCAGCGTCMDRCPSNAIYMVDGKAYIDEARCRGCGVCMQHYPHHAIQENKLDPAYCASENNTVRTESPKRNIMETSHPFRDPLVLFLIEALLHPPRAYSVWSRWSRCPRGARRRRCGKRI